MVNLLPAVLVGGPPHAGKSVLFYRLTQALRENGIAHHAIRACPDGEGNWFHEGDPTMVSTIRTKLTGEWPPEFVLRMRQDLEHRCLPFLVDMGGRPRGSQIDLLHVCTHSILLVKADEPDGTALWENLIAQCNLLPLARLFSLSEGNSIVTSQSPLLEGTLTGLHRHMPSTDTGPLFPLLGHLVATLFNSYALHDKKKAYLEQAPTEIVIDLEEALRTFTTTSTRWEPTMLQPFLESLPMQVPLSIYGIGPSWLYAVLSVYQGAYPFYLFDPKLPFGWIQPAHIALGTEKSAEIHIETHVDEERTVLSITFPYDRLEYFQLYPIIVPPVSTEKGLIIDGRIPNWLLTALMRLYKEAGVPWIAPFYVQSNRAIIAYSRVEPYQIGDSISKSAL